MRYLSKIVFIESAKIKYAEVNLDGNVHFIGTQGVGKSTLLRALLFFYNANQLKLGIPIGKKNFAEFYLPYQNSYIIYEVVRETGPFCILISKSQGKPSFRFLNTPYDKRLFIDDEGKILESWDKIKLSIGKSFNYTRKIELFEDYRNILYGNSQSLGAEFRKYSLLESKQYQNIPRAIQHVFLNYKVESEFIKDTIIKSLNEEEIKIDLTQYAHHLKDFDTQLGDIQKWTEKTKSGEVIVRKQADKVVTTLSAIKYLEREKKKLAGELVWQLEEIKQQQPQINDKFDIENNKRAQLIFKINDLDKKFNAKRDTITAKINVFDNKLKEARIKADEYAKMDIGSLIIRVAKKGDLESERKHLTKQKLILEAEFTDINQKYEAQIDQLTNQLLKFENSRHTEINSVNTTLLNFKEALSGDYEQLYEDIKKQHAEELDLAKKLVDEKLRAINDLKVKKAGAKNKRFFEAEIEQWKNELHGYTENIRIAESEIKQHKSETETIKKQWELEKERAEEKIANRREAFTAHIKTHNDSIASINYKIENSKDSLYGWLNKEYPEWEKTIGKVIDEDHVLFKSGLSPEKVPGNDLSFYGVKLALSEITKSVKTVADYENDIKEINSQIEAIQNKFNELTLQLNTDLEKLKNKFQPKIVKYKEAINNCEYNIVQNGKKQVEAKVNYDEFLKKAEDEKARVLETIEINLQKLSEEKINAGNSLIEVENRIKTTIAGKKKEKENKVKAEELKVKNAISLINAEIADKKVETTKSINQLKSAQKLELDSKGADTHQISAIDEKLSTLGVELEFIDTNRDIVAVYNNDKRDLFDKTSLFKNQKTLLENQLGTEQSKSDAQKQQLQEAVNLVIITIESIKRQLEAMTDDLEKYKSFELTDCYKSLPELLFEPDHLFKTEKRCSKIIDELNITYYSGIDRYRELQEAINKFNGNFSDRNIFSFKTNLIQQSEYFQFAEDLKEFIEEDKISLYEKRVNELFADIIKQIGKETTELQSKEAVINEVIININKDFVKKNFVGVIKSIELRVVPSANEVVHLLTEIKQFNVENLNDLGEANLFSTNELNRDAKNKKAVGFLTQLVKEISNYKHNDINLSDSFELEFKIIENDNDTNWVQNIANVGSDGTDVLVKAMINIMLLNVFKEGATKNRFKDFRLHCMMDEIGKLHPTNVRGILKFANDRNINLINSSPQSFDALAYRYTYKLAKDENNVTIVNRLITNNRER